MYVCIYYALGKSKVGSTSAPGVMLAKKKSWLRGHLKWLTFAMTVTRRQICEIVKHIPDLTKRPNAFMETDQGRKTESIAHTRQHCMSSV